MSIERIQIKDFQCHEDKRIKLDPHVTAITGPSDRGKSSILRALRWVSTNRPRGDGFIRVDQEESSVSVWAESEKVRRVKGKENTYHVNDTCLKAFGSDVPSQVYEVLKIDDMNFQNQHDPPFWLGLTPGEVTKRLNDIVDLGLIDRTISSLSRRNRTAVAKADVVATQLKEAVAQREELDFVEDMDEDLQHVERLKAKWDKKAELAATLFSAIQQWTKTQDRAELLKTTLLAAEELSKQGEICLGLEGEADELGVLVDRAEDLERKTNTQVPDISSLQELASEVQQKQSDYNGLVSLVEDEEKKEKKVREIKLQLEDAESEFEEAVQGQCPICGSEVDDEVLL